ncbi:GIY-YIG nuclease family protein [Zongyangia hominis]|uniref:GIY-YIG nuclease family protein n=1 Tax=Zongyangia hominis TaxID=2763677 RepID=A0A926EC34_9FIRM|nr:GIY-YIG nuclease family protein [Zongyangia hominis]MBC8570340.1 GIY-YIG nuclease family protein [Zongyangia hominis]
MAESRAGQNGVYILRCADGTLYTGWTNDLHSRLAAHNAGKGAKYTKGRRPVELMYWETHLTKGDALRRECAIKRLTRAEKEALIARGGKDGGL